MLKSRKCSACSECKFVFNIMFRFIPLYHIAIDNISSIFETDIAWHKLSATYALSPLPKFQSNEISVCSYIIKYVIELKPKFYVSQNSKNVVEKANDCIVKENVIRLNDNLYKSLNQ